MSKQQQKAFEYVSAFLVVVACLSMGLFGVDEKIAIPVFAFCLGWEGCIFFRLLGKMLFG